MAIPVYSMARQFDPRRIAGIEQWLDASDASTLYDATTGGSLVAADGGVGRWEDKSGKARHATQATANNRPQRKTQAIGGLDALLFDGSNDVLSLASYTISQPFVTISVVRHATASGGPHFIYDAPSGSNRSFLNHGPGGASSNAGLFSGTALNSASGFFAAGVTAVVTGVHNGASSAIRRNAVQQAAGDAGANGFANGTIGGSPAGFVWNGHVCEFLLFSGALSASQLEYLERGLMAKWKV